MNMNSTVVKMSRLVLAEKVYYNMNQRRYLRELLLMSIDFSDRFSQLL